jgi:predicted nucleic acid-binding protein
MGNEVKRDKSLLSRDLNIVVLDTNVLVAAGFNPRSTSRKILDAVRGGQIHMAWNDATRGEIEYVLHQIPPLHKYPVGELFHPGEYVSSKVDTGAFSIVVDPDDREFAALAKKAGAVLVSNDEHLLGKRRQLDLVIMTPTEYWKAWQDTQRS